MVRDMPTDGVSWQRLARYIEDRRAARGWTQTDVADRGGFSVDRLQELEKGERTSYRITTLGALERGLMWEAGSARAVLDGNEPTPTAEPASAPAEIVPVPVGANVDPQLLLEAVGLDPAESRRVTDFIRGIKAGRQ